MKQTVSVFFNQCKFASFTLRVVCTNFDQSLIADQRVTSGLKMVRKAEQKGDLYEGLFVKIKK